MSDKNEAVQNAAAGSGKERAALEQEAALAPGVAGGAGELAGTECDADLTTELAKAREEVRLLQDKVLRLAAELENFKKRMQRERETALKYAEENLLRELLPSLDNLERAVEQGRNTEGGSALLAGVEMTCRGMASTLEKFGLKPINGVGQPFDPNFHEALAMEPSDTVEENRVILEYVRGYMFKDRLLRAAKVVVSRGRKSC